MYNIVAYYRLSKANEGRELGIDAQEAIVRHYHKDSIVKEFYERKSAKNITDRPVLQEAIKYCIDNGYILVVAKLDRLSRDVDDCRAILKLMKGKLQSCDIPSALDKFTVTMYTAFAERERELISLRTSQALQAKKVREGKVKLHAGSMNKAFLNGTVAKAGRKERTRKALANENNIRAGEMIVAKVKEGMNFNQISSYLNSKAFKTAKGKDFQPVQVQRIYARCM